MTDPAAIDLKVIILEMAASSSGWMPPRYINDLIAAVEALRERATDLEKQNITIRRRNGAYAEGMAKANDRAEASEARVTELEKSVGDAVQLETAQIELRKAAEARVVELAGALEDAAKHCTNCDGTGTAHMGDETEWSQAPGSSAHPCVLCKGWRKALSTLPAAALERTKAEDDVIAALSKRTSAPIHGPSSPPGFLVKIYFGSGSDANHCSNAIVKLDAPPEPST